MSRGLFDTKIEKAKRHFGNDVEEVSIENKEVTVKKTDGLTTITWKARLRDNFMFELMALFTEIRESGNFTFKGMIGPFVKFVFRLAKRVVIG